MRFSLATVLLSVVGLAVLSPIPASGSLIEMGGGKIDVVFEADDAAFPQALALDWITAAARAVTKYYGRFPVAHALIRIRPVEGDQIGSGRTFGTSEGGLITVAVGRSTAAEHFQRDWLMTHEMIHLAFPSVAEEHHWIEEGISTYVEPIARARIGNLRPEQVWSDFLRDMPQGLPEADDRGLDFTPTWGRTYWGGALFCLLADVEIRQRTANAKGLEDALRAILQAGGTIAEDWDLERALRVGDRATGVPVLQELYSKMRAAPAPLVLDDLWRRLGIERSGRTVTLHDSAPLSAIRRAIIPEQ